MTATPNQSDWNNEILEAVHAQLSDVINELDVLSAQKVAAKDYIGGTSIASVRLQLSDILETLDDIDGIKYDVDDLSAAAQKWLEKIGLA